MQPALEALPQIKRERKIFFLVDWLGAFIGGQQSPAAQEQVYEYLKTANIDQDLRLKILQVADELDRTVAIRQKFPRVSLGTIPSIRQGAPAHAIFTLSVAPVIRFFTSRATTTPVPRNLVASRRPLLTAVHS